MKRRPCSGTRCTRIEALPGNAAVMLKLTIPTQPGRYAGLAADPRVLRVLALSGG